MSDTVHVTSASSVHFPSFLLSLARDKQSLDHVIRNAR
jgi:hypothetical protein